MKVILRMKENNIQIIILAAGHGKRMKNDEVPKVLVPLHGKPMIAHLLESIVASGVCERPLLVVGQKADMVKAALGEKYDYVFQQDQLGTGHAVAMTRPVLEGKVAHVMVLYGDHPLVSVKTIRSIADEHFTKKTALTMATVRLPDFNDWRAGFADFGRIIRDAQGNVIAIVEKRDATASQLGITEVNPSYFCFRADWLWNQLALLRNNNSQHEYYLTDLVSAACRDREEIATVQIDAREALGVNTPEQLNVITRAA